MANPFNTYQRHDVSHVQGQQRLTDYCADYIPSLGSRSSAKKAIAAGKLLLNGEPAHFNDLVRNGDLIEWQTPPPPRRRKLPPAIDIPIVYEDDHLIVVNKPGGIAVNGNRDKTVENALRRLARPSPEEDAFSGPVAAHRLDVPTKGLLLLAKTKTSLIRLNKAFQEGEVGKAYVAVVHGKPPRRGRISSPVDGKSALTSFKRLRAVPSRVFGELSMLRLKPHTGRTHQLRIHLKNTGHRVVGDKQYSYGLPTILGKGLFLCSCLLSFAHPVDERPMSFEIDPPARFLRLLQREEDRFTD
ncbi:MAG: RluA family pseudouridine synthase [Bacteroidota bacterium]